MYQSIINNTRSKMQEVIQKFQESLQALRLGRAQVGLVENIEVNYYGQEMPLKQLASISAPQSNLIVITPWDKNSLGDIELAIRNSDLGLSPVNEGNLIRLVLPPITEERREELIKIVRKNAEEAKVSLRQIRQQTWGETKSLEKEGKLTEDDRYRSEEELNTMIEEFNKKIEEVTEKREGELKRV